MTIAEQSPSLQMELYATCKLTVSCRERDILIAKSSCDYFSFIGEVYPKPNDCALRFIAALWNRAGHYVSVLWFLLLSIFFFLLLFSSPILSRCSLDVYHTSTFHTCCGLSANLGCRSETCCTRLAENLKYRTQKSPKIRHLRTIAQIVGLYLRNERYISTT